MSGFGGGLTAKKVWEYVTRSLANDSNVGATGDAANAGGSVLARLAELLTNRITAARAANLDAAISSRASAADYTAGRAAKIDNLDTTISSRAGSVTVQRGSSSFTGAGVYGGSPAITTINPAKSFCNYSWTVSGGPANYDAYRPIVTLGTDTITFTSTVALGASYTLNVSWEVIQFA